jgi:hypothetical protein
MNNNCIIKCRKGRCCRSQWPRDQRLSLAVIAVSNPTEGHGCLSPVSVVCCRVDFSASGRSLVQRSPTECSGSEHDHEVYIMRRSWPTRG